MQCNGKHIQTRKVAVNDVLQLKAARPDVIANFELFGSQNTGDLISMVSFTFAMRRHLIPLAPLSQQAFTHPILASGIVLSN